VSTNNETAGYRESNGKTLVLLVWTFAWAASLAAARFGPQFLWDAERQPLASWTAVAINVAVGIGWIIAFARFLRALDDLQRKIMQDTLAVTLGAGWIGGFAYFVADAAGLINYDFDLALFPGFLGLVYVVAFAVGRVRYR
jgi:hypothetical protein